MTRIFSGVCICGPKAGEWLEHHAPMFQVNELLSLETSRPSLATDSETVEFKQHVYVYEDIHFNEGNPISFWRLNTMTARQAVNHLFERYDPS